MRHRLAKQRLRIVDRVEALRDGDLADLFQGRAVLFHVQSLNQCHQGIRPAIAKHIDEVAALIFELALRRRASIKGIAADQDRQVEMAALDGIRRAPDAHHAAGAAVIAVQHPVDFQSQLLRHVRRIVGTRLRGNRKSANLFFIEPRLFQRGANRIGVIRQRRRLGLARIFRRPVTDKTNFFPAHWCSFQSSGIRREATGMSKTMSVPSLTIALPHASCLMNFSPTARSISSSRP